VVLDTGTWAWLWNHGDSFATLDAARIAADLRAHGIVGVLPHGTATAVTTWLRRGALAKFTDAGIAVCPSLSYVRAPAILACLELDVGYLGGGRCMMDWEGWWDGQQALATQEVNRVLAAAPDAAQRVTDCPWWAPLFLVTESGRHQPTHPRAPTKEFGRLATQDRYVEAYGAPESGRSARMLAWARSPTQYASLGSWTVRGAFQLYERSLNDTIRTTLAEPTQCLWSWLEADADPKKALRVVLKLRELGFVGVPAVTQFQASRGLVVDDVVGTKTLAALGIK